MEARPQGRGGRGAGQSKPLTNGKHTLRHHSNCPFLLQRGRGGGRPGGAWCPEARHDFKIGPQPCHNPWLL